MLTNNIRDFDSKIVSSQLANRLGLPWREAHQAGDDYSHVLWVAADGLAIGAWPERPGMPGPTRVDFMEPAFLHRLHTSGRQQGLAKAAGLGKYADVHVLDATAGLGRDAMLLAWLGARVTLLERSPLVHVLLEDGLRRAALAADATFSEVLARMHLERAEARERFALLGAGSGTRPDVIYLDPMFPPRGKSARVKKDLELLQDLLGAEDDFPGLLEAARNCATRRVVVKRPGNKPLPGGLQPDWQVPGRTAHFEVWNC